MTTQSATPADLREAALRMAREALAEFHQTGDVPTVLDVIDAALRPNAALSGKPAASSGPK